jgi:hypothetical protein
MIKFTARIFSTTPEMNYPVYVKIFNKRFEIATTDFNEDLIVIYFLMLTLTIFVFANLIYLVRIIVNSKGNSTHKYLVILSPPFIISSSALLFSIFRLRYEIIIMILLVIPPILNLIYRQKKNDNKI